MPTSAPNTEELTAWLRLAQEPGLSAAQARHLLAAAGLPQHVYDLSVAALCKIVPEPLAVQLHRPPDAALAQRMEASLQWLQAPMHHVLTLADPDYPQTLLDLADPPLLLYVYGSPARLSRPAIGIVGARNATADGVDNAHAFAKHLARQGWCVISGLAQGIDAAAHRGALAAGQAGGGTVAVLGTGIDVVYPASHCALSHQIAQDGALVSEFALGCRALPHQFPRRNRLVAAMARGVLVVEAARQSGSLITARHALDVGREVFAIPGSIHSPLSRGCHALIRQGAKLVESARDIQEELGSPGVRQLELAPFTPSTPSDQTDPSDQANGGDHKGGNRNKRGNRNRQTTAAHTSDASRTAPRDAEDAKILMALGHAPTDVAILQNRTQLSLPDLTARLAALELDNVVARLVDGRFQRRQG